MSAAGAAIGAASTAVVKFASDSVQVGQNFDKSMSQVAATMGKTVDEIQNLRDFAQEMGSTTAFSASQAADALNYMALAGYDAETSMNMLPNVLNLAAAGGMELATASDMVTDASSALGLSIDETSELVDKMAKASSISNTSVSQLGDAILTVGGTAKNMAGGTTELAQVLGILADNGVKGAEGGTALRNIILSLSAPTDAAAKKIAALGLKVNDAEGNMRPMKDIMGDLNGILGTMTQGERTQVLSELFNKVDLKSVNALLDTNVDRWDELTEKIDDAQGAAEQMAATQLDNLAGDITLFQSALEGAKIAVSDELTPTLRQFVQFGSDGVSRLTAAFKEGGLSGAMKEFGSLLSEGLSMVIDMLPQVVSAGVQLLEAFIQGIVDNIPQITSAAVKVLSMFAESIIKNVPTLLSAAGQIVMSLAQGIADNIDELAQTGLDMLLELLHGMIGNDGLSQFMEVASKIIESLATWIGEYSSVLADAAIYVIGLFAAQLTNPDTLMGLLESALMLMEYLAEAITDNLPFLIQVAFEIIENLVNFISEALPELAASALEILQMLANAIVENLPVLIDSAVSIVTQLIDTIMENLPEFLTAALEIITELALGLVENIPALVDSAIEIVMRLVDFLIENVDMLIDASVEIILALAEGLITNLPKLLDKAPELIGKLTEAIIEAVPKLLDAAIEIIIKLAGYIAEQFPEIVKKGTEIIDSLIDGIKQVIQTLYNWGADLINKVIEGTDSKIQEFKTIGDNIVKGIWKGISDGYEWIKDKISGWVGNVLSFFKNLLGIASPSKVFAEMGGNLDKGLAVGIDKNIKVVTDSIGRMSDAALDAWNPDSFNVSGSYGASYSGYVSPASSSESGLASEIRALRTDMNSMIRAIGNMNVVLDSGATVGHLTDPFNKSLGQQYVYAARGIA